MDEETVKAHASEVSKQPLKYKTRVFDFLSPQENAAFEILLTINGRLEQEKMNQAYLLKRITQSGR